MMRLLEFFIKRISIDATRLRLFFSCHRLPQICCDPSRYATAFSIVVNLGRDDESEPEEDSHAENIDYDYDPESPARNLPQREESEEKRKNEYHVIEQMLHFANLIQKGEQC